MTRRILTAAAALAMLAAAACGGDDTADPPLFDSGAPVPGCDSLPGQPTDVVVQVDMCTVAGNTMFTGYISIDCNDGRKLYWNDQGWGYTGGMWRAHPEGQTEPSTAEQTACNSGSAR